MGKFKEKRLNKQIPLNIRITETIERDIVFLNNLMSTESTGSELNIFQN